MPPRRSCFAVVLGRAILDRLSFQCHHGVPASPPPRGPPGRPGEFQCHHGVPASPAHIAVNLAVVEVSMPPRRSCFRAMAAIPAVSHMGFNATTAFLLRRRPTMSERCKIWFQCHHGVPASVEHVLVEHIEIRFQCHHGVPASKVS